MTRKSPSSAEPAIPQLSERQKNTPANRRRFTKTFKADAVRLVTHDGFTQEAAAEAIGIAARTLGDWVRAASLDLPREARSGDATPAQLAAEIRRLQKELATARMETQILKKATAFFAKESS